MIEKNVKFDYAANQKYLDSLYIGKNECANLYTNSEEVYTYQKLADLTSSFSNVYNVVDRYRMYNGIINSIISEQSAIFNEYVDSSSDISMELSLHAAPTHVMFNPGVMELVGRADKAWVKQRYKVLSGFFKNATRHLLGTTEESFADHEKIPNIDKLFGDCNLIETSAYLNNINYGQLALSEYAVNYNRYAYVSDITTELYQFIDQLEKIRIVNTKITFLQNNHYSQTIAYQKELSDLNNDDEVTRTSTQLYVTPYTSTLGVLANVEKNKVTNNNDILKDQQVCFKYLVKLNSIINFSTNGISKLPEHSNGIYAYDNLVECMQYDFRKTCKDFEDIFQLKEGCIMSKANVLKAIDYIFYQWLNNIQIITFTAVICHNNCHTNTVGILSMPEGEHAEEPCGCCACCKCDIK